MNVLMVNANRCTQPMPVIPLGACLVAEATAAAGHQVHFLDLMAHADLLGALRRELALHNPDVVGFSLRNIDNNEISNPVTYFSELIPLVEAARAGSQAMVVVGGAALAVMPEALLRKIGADVAVLGDGETVFPALLDALSGKRPLDGVSGIMRIHNGTVQSTGRPCNGWDPDRCVAPDFRKWLDVKIYQTRMTAIPLQTKRGCPFECIYCTYSAGEGKSYRLRTPAGVVTAVRSLVSRGLKDIEFVDNVFNAPYEHGKAVCDALAHSKVEARFQTLELNPAFLDDALLDSMEAAGFVGIGVTAESASDPVLKGLRKGFTADNVRSAAEVVKRHSLPCCWIFMVGGPGETRDTVKETLDFAARVARPNDVVFFNRGIRIYPGTGIEQLARAEGLLHREPLDMLNPVFYVSPAIELDWMIDELGRAARDNFNFMVGNELALPLLQKVVSFSYKFGLRPPLWPHSRSIRRVLKVLRIYP